MSTANSEYASRAFLVFEHGLSPWEVNEVVEAEGCFTLSLCAKRLASLSVLAGAVFRGLTKAGDPVLRWSVVTFPEFSTKIQKRRILARLAKGATATPQERIVVDFGEAAACLSRVACLSDRVLDLTSFYRYIVLFVPADSESSDVESVAEAMRHSLGPFDSSGLQELVSAHPSWAFLRVLDREFHHVLQVMGRRKVVQECSDALEKMGVASIAPRQVSETIGSWAE